MLDEATRAWFERHGLKQPEHIKHDLTPDDIATKVQPVKPTGWRAEGNRLIADTDMGQLVQFFPTDYIFKGTDANGLPILEKL